MFQESSSYSTLEWVLHDSICPMEIERKIWILFEGTSKQRSSVHIRHAPWCLISEEEKSGLAKLQNRLKASHSKWVKLLRWEKIDQLQVLQLTILFKLTAHICSKPFDQATWSALKTASYKLLFLKLLKMSLKFSSRRLEFWPKTNKLESVAQDLVQCLYWKYKIKKTL